LNGSTTACKYNEKQWIKQIFDRDLLYPLFFIKSASHTKLPNGVALGKLHYLMSDPTGLKGGGEEKF